MCLTHQRSMKTRILLCSRETPSSSSLNFKPTPISISHTQSYPQSHPQKHHFLRKMFVRTAAFGSSGVFLKPQEPNLESFSKNPSVSVRFSCFSSPSSSVLSLLAHGKTRGDGVVASATAEGSSNLVMTGVLFQPFEEVKREEFIVPISPQISLVRQRYYDECESAINEQINVEYNVSYVYHAMYAYFDRDNVALKGLAKFFKESSEEERDHSEKLMEYQNKRGGKVKLHSIVSPPSEFDHVEKGDALYAMELALSLEKLTNEKLLQLHAVAERNNDPQMQDFIESEFLAEQVEAIKKIADYVSQLRRVGKGHGVWHFDQMLLEEGDHAAA